MAEPDHPLRQTLEELGEEAVRMKNAQYEWGGPGTSGYATASEWLRKKDEARADVRDSRMRSLVGLGNWIAVIVAILALIAALPVIRGWFLPSPISDKSATAPQQQSPSAEPSPTKAKTSVSSDHPSEPPKSK